MGYNRVNQKAEETLIRCMYSTYRIQKCLVIYVEYIQTTIEYSVLYSIIYLIFPK